MKAGRLIQLTLMQTLMRGGNALKRWAMSCVVLCQAVPLHPKVMHGVQYAYDLKGEHAKANCSLWVDYGGGSMWMEGRLDGGDGHAGDEALCACVQPLQVRVVRDVLTGLPQRWPFVHGVVWMRPVHCRIVVVSSRGSDLWTTCTVCRNLVRITP